jgi:hypothetical protein
MKLYGSLVALLAVSSVSSIKSKRSVSWEKELVSRDENTDPRIDYITIFSPTAKPTRNSYLRPTTPLEQNVLHSDLPTAANLPTPKYTRKPYVRTPRPTAALSSPPSISDTTILQQNGVDWWDDAVPIVFSQQPTSASQEEVLSGSEILLFVTPWPTETPQNKTVPEIDVLRDVPTPQPSAVNSFIPSELPTEKTQTDAPVSAPFSPFPTSEKPTLKPSSVQPSPSPSVRVVDMYWFVLRITLSFHRTQFVIHHLNE